ncbi:MAG: helix-turn-helix transcriptional regulator [Gemmataceae bacterium]|nr:helix-turn-helix transcriptional regulator [Gemmataceae bacterium]
METDRTIYHADYPSRRLLDVIGDKWTPIVLFILGKGTGRHGELQRQLPDVSKKMLTQTLRRLERDGLITRTVYAEVPPRVEYDLTPLGEVFLETVNDLCAWAGRHTKELDAVKRNRAKQGPAKKAPAKKGRAKPAGDGG